jgi:hypothetical protein
MIFFCQASAALFIPFGLSVQGAALSSKCTLPWKRHTISVIDGVCSCSDQHQRQGQSIHSCPAQLGALAQGSQTTNEIEHTDTPSEDHVVSKFSVE